MDRVGIVVGVLVVVAIGWMLYKRSRVAVAAGIDRVNPADFGFEPGAEGRTALLFSSPYCRACAHWREALEQRGVSLLTVDVSVRGDLANRYKIRSTPLVLAVALHNGAVLAHYTDEPKPEEVEHMVSLLSPAL